MAGWGGPAWTQNSSCASSASASLVAASSTLMRCGCGVVATDDAEVDVVGVFGCAIAEAAEDITWLNGLMPALLVAGVEGVSQEDEAVAAEDRAGSDLDDLDLHAKKFAHFSNASSCTLVKVTEQFCQYILCCLFRKTLRPKCSF